MGEVLNQIQRLWTADGGWVPFLAAVAVVAVVLWGTDRLSRRRASQASGESQLAHQLRMLALTGAGLIVIVVMLPIEGDKRGQLVGLLGIALTAVITLSSTTFVSNAMAGLMLRAMGKFGPGDFISVAGEFGRVTERGLVHTEIQTEDRDLVTLPNFYLMSQTVKVVRRSGTIISAAVSIGYDEGHERVTGLLVEAAEKAGLEEPFAQVVELGDFSVSYRAAGFLGDVKTLISARSTLRASMIDALHGAGVEIVSPTFMNQRRLDPSAKVLAAAAPEAPATTARRPGNGSPEALMFDKAELADRLGTLHAERETLLADIAELEKSLDSETEAGATRTKRSLDFRSSRLQTLEAELGRIESTLKDEH